MGEPEPLVNRDALLDEMRNAAYQYANVMLSKEGREALRMISYVDRNTEMGIVEAYKQSEAFNRLPPDDKQRIEIYLARITLGEDVRTYEAHEG